MVAKIPFHGKFTIPGTDEPAGGTVSFTPTVEVRDTEGVQILVMIPAVFELDSNGEISGELYPTDDETLVPPGWAYEVREQFLKPGSTRVPEYGRVWFMGVPADTPGTLELSDTVDSVPFTPFTEYATVAAVQMAQQTADDAVDTATDAQTQATGAATAAGTALTTAQSAGSTAGTALTLAQGALAKSQNLADIPDKAQARTNLGIATNPSPGNGVVAEQAYGQASSAGISGTFSRSDHTHGTPAVPPRTTPARDAVVLGLQAVTMSFFDCTPQSTSLILTAGLVVLQLWHPGQVPIARLGTWLVAAGVTANGTNAMGLWTADGQSMIDQTGDMSTLLASGSGIHVEQVLGASHTLSDSANYYVGILTHFATAPKVAGSLMNNNVPSFRNNPPPSIVITGQTNLPTTFDPFSATKNNGSYFMTGS